MIVAGDYSCWKWDESNVLDERSAGRDELHVRSLWDELGELYSWKFWVCFCYYYRVILTSHCFVAGLSWE